MADIALRELRRRFNKVYAKTGRPSIAPEKLLRFVLRNLSRRWRLSVLRRGSWNKNSHRLESMSKPKYKRHDIVWPKSGEIAVYASPRHSIAIQKIGEMDTFDGIKILDLLDTFYKQGQKDGRREVIERFQEDVAAEMVFLPPGQPKKKKKR